MTKADPRIQRTRERLQKALIELIRERSYDAITIQDIVDRANVGRTTFYLHYSSKDELLISCHEAILSEFHLCSLSREELLSSEAPTRMIAACRHLEDVRGLLYPFFQGRVKDSWQILRHMRDRCAEEIEAGLRAVFVEADSPTPLEILANYLAGAQIALVQWWLEKRRPYTPEDLAQALHRLQWAVIRGAFGRRDGG